MKCAIGQDSHRFDFDNDNKPLILGGVIFENHVPLKGNSDADVVLHSLINAVSGITCVNILGEKADKMCLGNGITDSSKYLKEALSFLDSKIMHVSFSIECKTPKITPKIDDMRKNIASMLKIAPSCIGITATSGEGLTSFGRKEGVQCFCIITVE